ncbi:tetratricopeptide repeat protein [Hymenobacter humi]|uniref:Tetratricopeptide repeat protein n=1 Tax=Hymenobacter humi TaxID=1411620 RepID=A0ABW2U815_9BACT
MFRHLVKGGYHLRSGFQQMEAVVKRYPSFAPARKTLGICQFAVGSLPEGYHWLLRLLGLTANVDTGLRNLALAAAQPHDFQTESQLYLTLIREGYYKKTEDALRLVERLHAQQPDNLLFSYLLISVHKRQHHGEAALAAYRARPTGPGYLPVTYLHHMAADLLLYQGDYASSERENLTFLRDYKGQHYRKDTAFKLYLAAWLSGQPAAAARYREQINQPGPTDVEEDNYAQHYYHEAQALNPILTRARLQIDGGYNRPALATLSTFRATPATLLRDRIEEPYRRARAYQGLDMPDLAKLAFERTLAVAGESAPYFAPQAALQLGYMAQEAGKRRWPGRILRKPCATPGTSIKTAPMPKPLWPCAS